MGEVRVQRRLAAIVAADVAGYSRLIEQDEEGTRERFCSLINDIVLPTFASEGGRVVKMTGDGFLGEYASAINAVRAGLGIQQLILERHSAIAPELRMDLRMGINVGDIIIEDDDIHGEAVNIAARLEGICTPGQVFVAGSAVDQVAGKLDATFEDLGNPPLKNISRPVRAFLVRSRSNWATSVAVAPPVVSERPTIAVLPFANLGEDPGQQYFADGMVEEIITCLSRVKWLTVIARSSSTALQNRSITVREIAQRLGVRYIVEGSVRRVADRIRISAKLIDTDSASQLWADRFDGVFADVFELQDRVTLGVVAAIEPSVRKAEIGRARRKRPESMSAYELYLRAVSHMYEVTPDSRTLAVEYAQKALSLDPDYAEAHGAAAWCYFARTLWEGQLTDQYRDKALQHATAVRSLQTEDATTLAHAAIAFAMSTGDFEAALAMIGRAIVINPSSVHAHGHGAVISTWAGRYEDSIAMAERSLMLSPFDPLSVMAHAAMAGAWLMQGQYVHAVASARKGLLFYPTHAPSHLITIAALMRGGRKQEAVAAASRYLEIAPTYRVGNRGFFLPGFDGVLIAAGLPA